MSRVALITGINGQDGYYLSRFLESKDYEVHGITSCSKPGIGEPPHNCYYCDFAEGSNLNEILDRVKPDEVYHLAAQSHVRLSFDIPVYTAEVTGVGTLRLLDAIRYYEQQKGKQVRFYQASSSEMFGKVVETPQSETTPFHPRSPYACAKVFSYWLTINYRESYNMFACNGILFNHESPRRGEAFVTRKITKAIARIKLGMQDKLYLGNIDAKRDWGFAGDYVEAMWLILQQEKPDDFVIGTGETHSVREFLEAAFGSVGLDWRKYVEIDPQFYRPAEVELLCADPTKAREKLKWEPKVTFEELARLMVEADLKQAEQEKLLKESDS
ncbi:MULTISPECIES: GDP-mannose 4,6-dehydratase [Gimesia]|uniref:GDP-mannose 4,6-dehydratase n=1 Tax=Gimesia chilikensis TaxID=2605989 RepID=A0A517WE28_9PLAN|nr:GDP-mannose 4,6-dehydratase [Gimesia chilikensis]QDT21359.1 GDP-mannose 4,6-dehydratase [Gimesia chilikensis]QDU03504.1 GDP-mannose 4,6-dehydratase [Gimesia chilikensis]